jgi:phosphate uptake regulator
MKGDEVDIKEEGNRLVVSTGPEKKEKSNVEIEVSDLDKDSLIFVIRGLFAHGYDEIKINFNKAMSPHHRLKKEVRFLAVIHKEIARSIGYEIIQERGNFVVMRKITECTLKEFDSILKRIFLLIIDASKDLYLGVKNKDFELIRTLEDKHDTITKFIGYNLRILNTTSYINYKDTPFLFHIISSLDVIVDILRNSAREIIDNEIIPSNDGIIILGEIVKTIEMYFDLYYNFSFKKCEKFSSSRDNILHMIKKASKKLSKEDIRLLTATEHAVEVFRELFSARIAIEY